jgi:hypothetical protein
MKRSILCLMCSAVTAFALESNPLIATAVTNAQGSLLSVEYDARKLTEELAAYTEVPRSDFYYLDVFPSPAARGTATLANGQAVEWCHYEIGGLYLHFKNGAERYFLHPDVVARVNAKGVELPAKPRTPRRLAGHAE